MSYGAMAADVAAWIESQGIGAFELMGHSMGGKVAMMVACALPRQVRRLIVVDIAPRRYHWPTRRAEFAAMRAIDLGRLASRAEAEALLVPAVPDWAMRKFLTTNLERAESGAWRWAVNLPVIEAALSDLEANPLFPGDRYEGETLFVAGGQSDYIRPEDHAGIRTHFPESRIATLAESGHNPHMDAREAFVRALGPRDS
jgi:pimeloyl-ACP methyl ester carboxylesterase